VIMMGLVVMAVIQGVIKERGWKVVSREEVDKDGYSDIEAMKEVLSVALEVYYLYSLRFFSRQDLVYMRCHHIAVFL